MSNSYRKNPIIGVCSGSDKADKKIANCTLRAHVRDALAKGCEIIPVLKEVSSPWDFKKDGKMRINNKSKLMRK